MLSLPAVASPLRRPPVALPITTPLLAPSAEIPNVPPVTRKWGSPAALDAPVIMSVKDFGRHLLHTSNGDLQANMELCGAHTTVEGFYDTATLDIPPGTQFETCATLRQDAAGRPMHHVDVQFSQPLKIKRGAHAFLAPNSKWGPWRGIADALTAYRFTGVSFGTDEPTVLRGHLKILGMFGSRAIDQKVTDVFVNSGMRHDPRTPKLALGAFSNIGQASAGPGTLSFDAAGTLPPELAMDLSNHSFLLIPGGPFLTQLDGTFDLRTPGCLDLSVRGRNAESAFSSSSLGFCMQVDARVGLEDHPDGRMHVRSAGNVNLSVHRLALDVRAKDMPRTGGIRITGGEIRTSRPYAPAVQAPVQYDFSRGVLNATGMLQVNVGAVFVDPEEAPPPFHDDSLACDVDGDLDLAALVPRFGGPRPVSMHQPTPPDYAVRGVVSVRPPKSDPVYYRMDITPAGPDFQLQPDYKPPQALRTL